MCKVRAVGLYTHRILIPYQAMFGSFSVPHLALHLATSLPGRELWMSSSRVHCSIEISVVTLGQITSRALHCLHHFQLVRLCMMETRARHEEPSAEHTVQLSFHLLHLRHDGRNCHTHTPISWLHTSVLVVLNHSPTARKLSSTPFRIVEVWDTPLQPQT